MQSALRGICFIGLIGFLCACGGEERPVLPGRPLSDMNEMPAATVTEDARCRLATADSATTDDCPAAGADADHDTVDDGADRCPDTTPGVAVDATGCARQ